MYCVQTSSLWGCGEFVNPQKVNIQEVCGFCPIDQRETQACNPFFRIFYNCEITPLTKMYWGMSVSLVVYYMMKTN